MQKLIIILSISISIIGIVLLFFLKPEVSPQEILLEGEVRSTFTKGKATFISMAPKNFTIVTFEEFDIPEGNITLVGRLQEYKGRVEFIADRILPEALEAQD